MKRDNEKYESEYVFDNAFEVAESIYEEQKTLFPGITDKIKKKITSEPIRRKKNLREEESKKQEKKDIFYEEVQENLNGYENFNDEILRHSENSMDEIGKNEFYQENENTRYYNDYEKVEEESRYSDDYKENEKVEYNEDYKENEKVEYNEDYKDNSQRERRIEKFLRRKEEYDYNQLYKEKEKYLEELEPKEYDGELGVKEEKDEYYIHTEEPEEKVETFDNKTVTQTSEPKKNHKSRMLLGILSLIGLLILGYIAFYFIKVNPKYILVKSLDNFTESFEKVIDPTKNLMTFGFSDDFTSTGTMKINIDMPLINMIEDEESKDFKDIIDTLNNMSFTIDTRFNSTDKKVYINFLTKLKEENLLDFSYVNQDKKQYILLKNVFEKYIQLDEETEIFNENNTNYEILNEDLDYIWNFVKNSFDNNIKDSYTETKNEELEIDGKKVKTIKVILVLNDENITELFSNIINDIKADERANNFVMSLYPNFENYKVTASGSDKVFYYSVNVTKGTNKAVKISFYDENDDLSLMIGEKKIFEVTQSGKLIIRANLSETEKGFLLEIEDLNDTANKIEITGNIEGEKSVYQATIKTAEVKVEAILNSTINEIVKGEEYKENGELSLSATYQDVKIGTVIFSLDVETKKGAIIDDVTDFITEDLLTEEDEKKIETYFEEFLNKIFPNFDKYLESETEKG